MKVGQQMKKFVLCKLCLVVFGVLLVAHPVDAANWNNSSSKAKDAKVDVDRNNCLDEESSGTPTLSQLKAAHIYCHQWKFSQNGRLIVEPSESPRILKFDVKDDPYVTEQLETTGLVSYLLFRDGEIVKDAISPSNRLGDMIDNDTRLISRSVGKSFNSYLLGHAICRGDIPSLEHRINDWPLLKDTLYEDQKLIDVVNMNVGDKNFFQSERVQFANPLNVKGVNHQTIRYWGEALKGTNPPLFRSFNYSQILSGLTVNYIAFKTQNGFEGLLKEVYADKVGVASPIEIGYVDPLAKFEDGRLSEQVFATRYDFLRIGKAMLDDWRSDSCVGRYLKQLYKSRLKGLPPKTPGRHHGLFRRHSHDYPREYDYAGFFHINPSRTKDTVFVAHGFGGQVLAINFDTGTIVVAHSVFENWDSAKLIIDAVNQ